MTTDNAVITDDSTLKIRSSNRQLLVLSVVIFAAGVFINLHYGIRGLPYAAYQAFDAGWRVFSGQVPYVDFMLASGLTPGVMQAAFYALTGVTVGSLVVHAALLNGIAGVLVFAALRLLGLARGYAAFYGLLTTVVFFPPVGGPYTNTHSYFFGLVIVVAQIAAIKCRGMRAVGWLYAAAGVAAIAGFFSKPIPLAGFLPLSLLLLFMLERRRLGWAVLGSAAGLLIALSPLLVIAAGNEGAGARIWYYAVGLPLGTGQGRLGDGIGLSALLKLFGSAYRFNQATVILLMAGGAAGLWLLARKAMAAGIGETLKNEGVPWAVGVWLLIVTIFFQGISQHSYSAGLPMIFFATGALHHALRGLIEGAVPEAPEIAAVVRRADGAVAALFVLVAASDALLFNTLINGQRGSIHEFRTVDRVDDVPRILGMESVVHFTMAAKTGYGTLEIKADQIRNKLAATKEVTDYMHGIEGGILALGVDPLAHGLAQKRSAFPLLNILPGVSSPLLDTPEYEDMVGVFERNLRDVPIDRLLVGREIATQHADAIEDATGLFCGRETRVSFDVLHLCNGVGKTLVHFFNTIIGADQPLDVTRYNTVLRGGISKDNRKK